MMICFKNSVFESCLLLIALICWFNANSSEAFGTFGLDIHHRYSDAVKQFLDLDGLPEKGTVDYYTAMAHHDQQFKGRRLAAASTPILTFYGADGNRTYRYNALSLWYYSLVYVGTPSVYFLVALDTSTNLFWIPCDCPNCARSVNLSVGDPWKLNIYSPSNSTTSKLVPCNSPICVKPQTGCSTSLNACSYQQGYDNTSTSGILVDDVLHLGTDVTPQDSVDVSVTFGCGINQTGSYLSRGGMNGVFGLGMGSISVPSLLASKNITANSFSLCFGSDGYGRIEFGDKGSTEQKTTPFNVQQTNPIYEITVTHVAVGKNITELEFTADFDSTTKYAYFSEPTYSFITNNFNSRITEKPYHFPFKYTFEYCYALGANLSTYIIPDLIFTTKGGSQFNVTAPTVNIILTDGGYIYCLGIIKNDDYNIIGVNFMTGHRLVFDREEMTLGWKESDCYDSISAKTASPPNGIPPRPRLPPPPPPTTTKPNSASSMTSGLVTVILAVFSYNFILL
ncbi:hypothetical protein ACP275_14G194300 [Erythranthe tilingii]